ncbi:MAG: GGDEF domain-containing protein [Candidatus Gastranaerophilales bacterium]|nr:GGDEF domain-containing protein [Candidatus Gastranaerophilales bacterium]
MNTKEQEFLNKLSNILIKKISPVNTTGEISKLFKNYMNIDKTEFIIWDNNNMILKDFALDWKVFNNDDIETEINYIYSSVSMSAGTKFYFNETEFDCDIKEEEQYRILELKTEKNNIFFPLVSNGEVFGLLKICSKKNAYTKEFFTLLNIASKLISGAIINYILNEQMEKSLNFYKAMKDIAKIIESQYELSYIIPLIGEMIDRFMSSHLIYIFIYKDNKYNLVWPNACKERNIYNLLKKIKNKTEYIISKDGKIGVFPIVNEDKILGAIAAYSNIEILVQKDIDYLFQLTRQSGLTIQRANMYAEVLKYATMDALTGLNNRRQFEIRLKQEVSNSKRNNIPLCAMMLDVDYFKKVNDTYGHAAGDCILKGVSEIIKNEIREYDIACRYGGEEFFIILPRTKLQEAASVAQRLRKVIEEYKMDIKKTGVKNVSYINISVSIGVCAYNDTMDSNSFIQKADKALYEAKKTGRNRVIVA